MTTAACTINHWRSNSEGPFDLIHDTSSKMAGEKWLWDQLVSPSLEAKVVGHDRRKWIFPLNVASTTFLDSKEVPQLQLSDLVAGATAMWARARWDDSLRSAYTDRLDEAGISEFIINISWPTEHVTPEDLGTDTLNAESAADFIGKKIKVPKANVGKGQRARENIMLKERKPKDRPRRWPDCSHDYLFVSGSKRPSSKAARRCATRRLRSVTFAHAGETVSRRCLKTSSILSSYVEGFERLRTKLEVFFSRLTPHPL